MRQHYALYVEAIVFFILTVISALKLAGFERNFWVTATSVLGILFAGIGYSQRNKPLPPLNAKKTAYLIIGSVFLFTLLLFIVLYGLGGFLIALIIIGFSAWCASIGSRGKSGYTAYRRKKSWTRKDGTVCYARKQSWTAREEEVPEWISWSIFFFVYFLITIPILTFSFI